MYSKMAEDVLVKERLKKLEELRKLGINPYPYFYEQKDHANELQEKYKGLKAEETTKDSAKVAGRIMTLRRMGKASFATLQDQSGKIQLYFRQDDMGEAQYKILRNADIGDVIGAEGNIFKTKTGEITVYVKKLEMLAKSIRPLPEKFHGLKDDEIRFRHRELDLITNPKTKEVLLKRAKIYKTIREFLDERGYIEVQPPILQTIYGGGQAKPFTTRINAWDMKMYLRIAYEIHLKRLLVGGLERVYALSSCFRNEGADKTHNPEFAMMEMQVAYKDYEYAMKITEELWEYVAKKVNGSTIITYEGKEIDLKAPWKRMTVKEAIKKFADIDVDKLSDDALKSLIREHKIEAGETKGEKILALFEELCEDKLIQPTHIIDHPKETAPLAKRHRDNPELVERVEPFVNGWEVGNCYSELTDPVLQRKLLEEQAKQLRAGAEEAHPMDEEYITALEHGLPPNCGIGIGVDRMIMLLTDSDSIKEVIPFPTMKPTAEKKEG